MYYLRTGFIASPMFAIQSDMQPPLLQKYAKVEVFVGKEVRGGAQMAGANTRGAAAQQTNVRFHVLPYT